MAQSALKLVGPKARRRIRVVVPGKDSSNYFGVAGKFSSVAPVYFSNFLSIQPLGESELTRLETALGEALSKEAGNGIDTTNRHFISVIALDSRFPAWSTLRDHLDQVRAAGFEFVRRCTPATDPDPNVGSFTAEQATWLYLTLNLSHHSLSQVIEGVNAVGKACEEAAEEIGKRASRRGTKSYKHLKAFCKQMIVAVRKSGIKEALDSNETRGDTAFVRFVHEALKIAQEKGDAALDASSLNESEKASAKGEFAKYANMPTKALTEHIRDIRRKVKQAVTEPNSSESQP